MPTGREPGTWKCPACMRFNRPTMATCRECGAAKPTRRAVKKRKPKQGSKVRVGERQPSLKRAETEKRIGPTFAKKEMSEAEARRARARSLASSPIANRIERNRRAREAREEEAHDER